MVYNVIDYGAKADGVSLDTDAIQAASDACFVSGGGIILIPEGKYLCGSVRLYSNTTVRIEQNAKLYLCTDESVYGTLRGKYDTHYIRDEQELMGLPVETSLNFMQKMFLAARRSHTDNMFYACGAENIVIEGDGVIDGQYEYFFKSETGGEDGTYETLFSDTVPRWQRRLDEGLLLPKAFRPHIVYMQECKNVRIRNLNLLNSPFFNIRIADSEGVRCESLNIQTNKRCQNTDGINLSGCRNCFITGCRIVTGDDCIAVSSGEMPPRKYSCENIVISDCIGSTYCNFFRIFNGIDADVCYEEGVATPEALEISRKQGVKNVSITNCILEKGGCFANLVAVYGAVEQVHIMNCTEACGGKDAAVFIAVQRKGRIRDITIDGLECRVKGGVTVQGTDRESIERVVLRNCRFYIEPTSKLFGNGLIDPLVQYWVSDLAPYNMYIRHATDVRFIDCEVEWGEADIDDIWEIADEAKRPQIYNGLWREDMNPSDSWPCIDAFDVDGLYIRDFRGSAFGDADVVRVRNVARLVSDSKADGGDR
ncbi:MAG: hypothetical protein IJ428_00990 [Clostridia bacterium]|nr:hypothetical protein [Clostridia bacterium]